MFLTFANHPIHDKDNRNGSKNEGKLKERHLLQVLQCLEDDN